jgi:hypothetical protein
VSAATRRASASTKAVEDGGLHEDARATEAHLALVGEGRPRCALDRGVEIGVLEDQGGVLAAELEAQLLEARGRHRGDPRAGRGAAGERHAAHVRVSAQRLAHLRAVAVDDVERAVGHAGLGQDLSEQGRGPRRELARLRDHRVAHRQRRRRLPRQQVQRQVPRRDQRDHAEGLSHRVVERVGHHRGARHELARGLGEEAQVRHGARDIHAPGQGDGLAAVLALQARGFVDARLEQGGGAVQAGGACLRAGLAPRPVQRGAGGGHGAVDVVSPAARDLAERRARGRVPVGEGRAGQRGHRAPGDGVADEAVGRLSRA